MSSKILKEAMIQQREVQEETEGQNPIKQVFAEEAANAAGLDEEDIDEFGGFSETQSQFGGYEVSLISQGLREFLLLLVDVFLPSVWFARKLV